MASFTIDIGNTLLGGLTINPLSGGGPWGVSGVQVGQPVDMLHAHVYTNLLVQGGGSTSGTFRVAVQVSDTLNSGDFVDPTSGLPQMPGAFLSGGVLICNSGAGVSGSPLASGVVQAAGFYRTGRYARAILLSGGGSGDEYNRPVTVALWGEKHYIGSGGGYLDERNSGGTINV